MTFDRHLIHLCTIQEYTESKNDDAEVVKAWSDKAGGTEVPFRLVEKTERYADEVKGLVLVTRYLGIFHHDEELEPGEALNDVVMRHDSSVVSTDRYQVLFVRKRYARTAHHLVAELELIT